jgi:hypothetical protein
MAMPADLTAEIARRTTALLAYAYLVALMCVYIHTIPDIARGRNARTGFAREFIPIC